MDLGPEFIVPKDTVSKRKGSRESRVKTVRGEENGTGW